MTEIAGANQTDYIAIAQLDPSATAPGRKVRGIVTLIWPYSVSNQTFSILLAEPDFRLRRQRGQVRVQFRGSSAKALARCDVQSGDYIDLTLSHVQWEKEGSASGTPGRGIEWELRFGERVILQIQREDQEPIELDIDHPAPSPERRPRSPPSLDPSINLPFPSTPVAFPPVPSRLQAWSTPAFLKRDRLSGISYFGSDYNPFDEDDFRDNNRRKKTKYGRASNQWRFTEQESSPESAAESKSPAAEPLEVNGVQYKTVEDDAKDADVQALSASDIATQEKQNKEQPVSQGSLVDAGVQVEDSLMDQIPAGPSLHGSITSQKQSPALELIDPRKAVNPENSESLEHKTNTGSAEIETMSSPSVDNGPFDQDAANSGSDDAVYPKSSQGRPPEIKSHSIPSQADQRNQVELNEAAENHDSTGGQESPGMEAGPNDILPRQPGVLLKESVDERSSQDIRSESSVLEGNGIRRMRGVSESAVQVTLAQEPREPEQHGFGSPQTAQDDIGMKSAIKETGVAPTLSFPSQEPVLSIHDQVDAGIAQESVKALFDTDAARALAISLVENRRMKSISPTSHHVNTLGGEQDADSVLTDDLQGVPQLPSPLPEQLATSSAPSSQEDEALAADKIQREESMESGSEHDAQAWSPSLHVLEASEDGEEEFSEEDRMSKEDSQERRASSSSVEGQLLFRSEAEDYSDSDMRSVEMSDEELESAQEEDDDDQAATAPQRSSAVQIITIDDSDEENVDVARSQTDGAIISALQETRQQSHPLGSLLPKQKTRSVIHSSPPPLPNTIPDSQAVAEAGEPKSDIESVATGTKEINVSSYPDPRSVSEQRSREDSDDPEDGADIKPRLLTASLSPEIPLENYIDPRLKNKALTPNDTQPREAVSQTSHILSQSFQDAYDLPTPQLTQNRSSDILLPASLRLSSPAARSSSPAASVASSSQPSHDVETSESIDQDLVEQLKKAEDRNVTIIALKPSARPRRVSNIPPSVSRWFAPRRSSEVVADSRSQSPAKSEESDTSDISERYADPKDIEVEEEEDQTAEEEEEEIPSSDIISPPKPLPSKSIFQRTSPTTPISTSTPPTGLRTSHAYYTPLSNLPSHFNTTTTTISIVLASLPITRASTGPRDFHTTLFLTDPSSLQAQKQPPLSQSLNSFQSTNLQTPTFTLARLFRPSRISLPQKPKKGDVILLRSCAVTSYSRTASLLSSNSSAWALFSYGRHNTEPAIAGPPVEFGAEERGYVRGLWEWWEQLEESTKEGVMEAVDEKVKKMEEKEERERMKGRRLKGMGLRLAPGSKVQESGSGKHELRDGKEWSDDVAGKSTTPRTPRRGRGMRHELRDGKEWVDVEAPRTSRRS
ncbi:MAG: hypothetical protein LQ337_000457 [Flavoplaca oasis]|nr:MAG: hypothetical protein LQ337_000457 [Flavoplaca oasis]